MLKTEATVNFHSKEEVSIQYASNCEGGEKSFMDLFLYSSHALRQMSNLGKNESMVYLSRLLLGIEAVILQPEIMNPPFGPQIRPYDGTEGGKRFMCTGTWNGSAANFGMGAKGFGFLARNVDYYASHAVMLLLRFFTNTWTHDVDVVRTFGRVSRSCAGAYLTGSVTVGNQLALATQITLSALQGSGEEAAAA